MLQIYKLRSLAFVSYILDHLFSCRFCDSSEKHGLRRKKLDCTCVLCFHSWSAAGKLKLFVFFALNLAWNSKQRKLYHTWSITNTLLKLETLLDDRFKMMFFVFFLAFCAFSFYMLSQRDGLPPLTSLLAGVHVWAVVVPSNALFLVKVFGCGVWKPLWNGGGWTSVFYLDMILIWNSLVPEICGLLSSI